LLDPGPSIALDFIHKYASSVDALILVGKNALSEVQSNAAVLEKSIMIDPSPVLLFLYVNIGCGISHTIAIAPEN
jgi:hypothetical protein